jgi:hypothetical protein
MFCAECGERLADGYKFCPQCGTPAAIVFQTAQPEASTIALEQQTAVPPPISAGAALRSSLDFSAGFDAARTSRLARDIFTRVKSILLSPSTEWQIIAAEASSAQTIYLEYVAPLVGIGVLATFLGQTLVGVPLPLFGTVRLSTAAAMVQAVVTFGLSLLGVFLIARIIDALAPTFGAEKDPLASLKLTAYSYTPAWVAAVLHLIPVLGILAVLAAFYGLYLLYLGLPVVMHSPKDKAVGYTVVVVLCAIVLGTLIGTLGQVLSGRP